MVAQIMEIPGDLDAMRDLGDIYPRAIVELRTIPGGVVLS